MSEREEAVADDEAIVMETTRQRAREMVRVREVRAAQSGRRVAGERLDRAAPLLRAFDVAAVLIAALVLLGAAGAAGWPWHQQGNARLVLVAALLVPFCFDRARLYEGAGIRHRLMALGRAASGVAGIVGLLVLLAMVCFADWPPTAMILAEWATITLALLLAGRAGVLAAMSLPAVQELARDRVAVLGNSELADELATHLEGRPSAVRLVGMFDEHGNARRRARDLVRPAAGGDLKQLAMRGEVDRVVIALPRAEQGRVAALTRDLSSYAIDVSVCLDRPSPWEPIAEVSGPDISILDGVPARQVVRRPMRPGQIAAKAIEDRLLGLLMLVGLTPLFLVIAVAIKLTSPGPVFFKQKRHGFRNREIIVYKFRSMRTEASDPGGRVQTMRGDPRITSVGGFLRSSSLDELPQLINVVRGEMSLVGPRPLPIDMRTGGLLCSEIVEDYANRHRVKPGITGWAQINGYRGATTTRKQVHERVCLDNFYIDNWSLLLDLKIMVLTLIRVFNDDNAF